MKYIIVLAASLILLASCGKKKQVTAASDIFYTCSMHPQIIQNKPGNCPICGMQLIQVNNSTGAKGDEIKLSAEQIELGNIHADTISKSSIGDRLVLTATLNFDQMKATSVSSRVMGRVERLYYKNLGDFVKKGSPLFDLYSEELNNAKQEFLLALDKRKTFASETVIDFDQLIQSSRNKLLLWGLSEQQISELEKNKKAAPVTTFYSLASGYITQMDVREGDYVMEGGTIVKLADLSALWAEAQVYTSQMAGINSSSSVVVQLPDFENKEIIGKIDFVNPEINPDTRINLIRVSIPNPGNQLKPGMPAYVILKSPKQQSLTLPIDAVIRDGKGATVWLQTGINSFKSVMVETGLESDDRIEIKSGLKEGDVVVISGAYLLHSEFIFKKGANPMDGMKM